MCALLQSCSTCGRHYCLICVYLSSCFGSVGKAGKEAGNITSLEQKVTSLCVEM